MNVAKKQEKISAQLRGNVNNWVEDCIENGDALLLREFFTFMKELGFEISAAQKKQLTTDMNARYAKWKSATRT